MSEGKLGVSHGGKEGIFMHCCRWVLVLVFPR